MRKYTIYTESIENSAITNITRSIENELRVRGYEVEVVDKIKDMPKNAGTIINLIPHHLPKLHTLKRFLSIEEIYTVLTPNFIEFQPHELAHFLLLGLKYPIVFPSLTSEQCFEDFAMTYLSAQVYRDVKKRVAYFGIGKDFHDTGENDRSEFVVPFTRVNETQKRISLHSKITKEIKKKLPETQHTFFVNPFFAKDKQNDYGYDRVLDTRNAEETARTARKVGFFISTSKTESFGLYYLELIASGVVGVFVENDWIRKLLPNYPYIYPEKTVVANTIKLYNNYTEAKKNLEPFRALIAEKYKWESFINSLEK